MLQGSDWRQRISVRGPEAGVSLLGLMVAVVILSVGLMVALPAWKYVIQDDREQELLFRGNEIARAIERYQAKNGGAAPANFEVLVRQKFLRRNYKDPFVKDGKWRRVRPGEMVGLPGIGGADRSGLGRSSLFASPSPGTRDESAESDSGRLFGRDGSSSSPFGSTLGSGGSLEVGPLLGVATRHKGESYRLFNGRNRYEEWAFVAGQPRVVGRTGFGPMIPTPGLPGASPQPGASLRPGFPGTATPLPPNPPR